MRNRLMLFGALLWCLSVDVTAQETLKIGSRVGVDGPTAGFSGQGRRDPFVPLVVPPSAPGAQSAAVGRRAPGLAGLGMNDVVVKGIVSNGTTRIALLAANDGKTYMVKVKDRLSDAVIGRIEADAVVMQTTAGSAKGRREVRKPLRPVGEGGGL